MGICCICYEYYGAVHCRLEHEHLVVFNLQNTKQRTISPFSRQLTIRVLFQSYTTYIYNRASAFTWPYEGTFADREQEMNFFDFNFRVDYFILFLCRRMAHALQKYRVYLNSHEFVRTPIYRSLVRAPLDGIKFKSHGSSAASPVIIFLLSDEI